MHLQVGQIEIGLLRGGARLTDGTPLITAQAIGSGWIVLFHTSASPGWSTLPISGLYVDMLKRLLALSAGTPARELAGMTSLPPVAVLAQLEGKDNHSDADAERLRADPPGEHQSSDQRADE